MYIDTYVHVTLWITLDYAMYHLYVSFIYVYVCCHRVVGAMTHSLVREHILQ